MENTPGMLYKYVYDMMYNPKKAVIDLDKLEPEYRELAELLIFLNHCLSEEREMAIEMSNGNLDIKLPGVKNVIAHPIKALHASLKHLTWQAKQIQSGDYSQHVDFMGEFSDVFNNMTHQLSERRDELETHAFRDPLTKLFNRRYGMEILNKLLEEKRAFSLCFVDLDNLKYINDKFGHSEGDKFILDVAGQLEKALYDGIVARVGGDEFMIMLPGGTEAETARRMEEVCAALAHYGKRPDGKSGPAMSYGIVEVKEDNTVPAGRILADADKKMYTMKAKHKERFHGRQ